MRPDSPPVPAPRRRAVTLAWRARAILPLLTALALLTALIPGPSATAAPPAPEEKAESRRPAARVVKVLPHLTDKQGRIALSPSLYERDAYQAHLRKTPAEQGGLRFDVQWKSISTNTFQLRVEMRGNKGNVGTTAVLEQKVKFTGFLTTWTRLHLQGEDYTRLGDLSAWRATLWDGDRMVAEQKSFLW